MNVGGDKAWGRMMIDAFSPAPEVLDSGVVAAARAGVDQTATIPKVGERRAAYVGEQQPLGNVDSSAQAADRVFERLALTVMD